MTAVLESVHRFATKVCTKARDVDCDEWLCTLNLPTLRARWHSLKLASYIQIPEQSSLHA